MTGAVKALVWNPFRAETPFGYYQIDDQTDRSAEELKGRPPFLLSGSRLDLSRHPTLADARAAAQADYERRVLSALTASASEPGPVADDSRETCQRCQGNGEIVTDWERYRHPNEGDVGDEAVAECPDCNGVGSVTVPTPDGAVAVSMTPEEHRLEDLKQMAAYSGPIVSFECREPYYLASCDHCGWVGSSELCGTDSFGDDSDVYCPRCHSSGADCGKVAETLSAALSHSADGWRGIESAPKDGSSILLFGRIYPPSVDAGKVSTVLGYWADINGGGWVWHGAYATIWTHWRPIPPGPLDANAEDGR